MKGLWLCLSGVVLSVKLLVMGEVCVGGGVFCNVASAEAIFMYLLDRCEVCVCVKCL